VLSCSRRDLSGRRRAGAAVLEVAVWERRAWAASFPGLGPPGEAEEWAEEAYLLPLGLGGRNIKIRGDALEIKDSVAQRADMQLWRTRRASPSRSRPPRSSAS
jgi:hypothetical protein